MAERIFAGRYQVVRRLARGGMAEVLLGRDELLGRTVAIKVLFAELSDDPSFVERFRREARAAAALNHHNIVSVYDFGQDDGSYFIVMEYVDGVTLRDLIRRGPMDPAEAVRIATAIATALAVAHAQGTIHRDVKPANVLLTDGAVKVTDFGIARAAADAQEGLTQPGMVLGTARYLSPEQARGKPVDHRSDIYSLGIVLYEMLAGGPPYPGESPVAVAARQVRGETPPPPSSRNPRVPPALDALVAKAMSVDPAARYLSAEELRAALLAVPSAVSDPDATVALGGAEATQVAAAAPATAVLPPVGPPFDGGRPSPTQEAVHRRRRAVVIGVVLLILLLLLGLILLLSRMGRSGRVTVPAVVGLTVADATAALDRAGLDARVVERARPGDRGQVIEQDPRAGADVDRGSTVSLFVAGGDTSPTTRAPTTATTRAPTTTMAPTTTTQAPTTTSAPPATTAPPPTSVVPSTAAPSTTR